MYLHTYNITPLELQLELHICNDNVSIVVVLLVRRYLLDSQNVL